MVGGGGAPDNQPLMNPNQARIDQAAVVALSRRASLRQLMEGYSMPGTPQGTRDILRAEYTRRLSPQPAAPVQRQAPTQREMGERRQRTVEELRQARNARNNANRRERDQARRDVGLTRGRDSMGRVIWE